MNLKRTQDIIYKMNNLHKALNEEIIDLFNNAKKRNKFIERQIKKLYKIGKYDFYNAKYWPICSTHINVLFGEKSIYCTYPKTKMPLQYKRNDVRNEMRVMLAHCEISEKKSVKKKKYILSLEK